MSDPETTAMWIRGRVIRDRDRVAVRLGSGEHLISRDQAVALGGRLLEVGIGTNYTEECALCAKIGDLICEARNR